MKKAFYLILVFISFSFVAMAVPAYPELITATQPDGTSISYYMKGDENFSFMTSADGYLLIRNDDNLFEYAEINENLEIVSVGIKASDIQYRTSKEKRYLKNALKVSDVADRLNIVAQRVERKAMQRVASKEDVPVMRYPLSGNPTSLVILVNFKDVEYTYTREHFDSLLNQKNYSANGATGSAKDYFEASSFGKFSPEFVVVGPYTLPQTRAYYGKNKDASSLGGDVNSQRFVIDACRAADSAGVDFSLYDTDGNKRVDNVFVYYAGYNEAEGGPKEAIWPHRSAVISTQEFDGVRLYDYACTSELRGSKGSTMCGIGTFVHEFGHVLGLPDLYVTDYAHKVPTLGAWDVMDNGPYNNQGRTPPSYSAYERFFLGWMKPTVLEKGITEVEPLLTSNSAYILSKEPHNLNGKSPNPNEFFMIENRQHVGWDTVGLPYHGLLVTHVDFNSATWINNTVNNKADDMGVQIVCAEETTAQAMYNTFPGKGNVKTCFITMKDGYQFPDPLANIVEDNSGLISFVYGETSTTPYMEKEGDIDYFNVPFGDVITRNVTISGHNIAGPVVFKMDVGYHFMIRKAGTNDGFSPTFRIDVEADSTFSCEVEIQYKPRRLSKGELFEDRLLVESKNYSIFYAVQGEAPKAVRVVKPVAFEATEVTDKSFRANWEYQEHATMYYLTVYDISNSASSEVEGFSAFNSGTAPKGWKSTFTEVNRQYYGSAKPALYFKNSTDTLWTKKYFFPVKSVSFYARSINTIGVLHLEGLVNGEWVSLKTFEIDTNVKGGDLECVVEGVDCQQFRVYYVISKGVGGIVIDDFCANFDVTANFVFDQFEVYDTSAVVTGLDKSKVYYYKVQASDKEDDKSLEENVTDYSNEVRVLLLNEDEDKARELKFEVTADGYVIVDLECEPTASSRIYIYNVTGQLVEVVVPTSRKVQLPRLQENGHVIVKFSDGGGLKRKEKFAKIFY